MTIEEIASSLIKCFKRKNFVYIVGNGGSAMDASHFCGELVNKCFSKKVRKALPMLSLCTDMAVISSIANDSSYADIFSRQLEAFGRNGDILLTLSTSGTSKNIIKAQEKARELGMEVIVFPTNKETSLITPYTQEIHQNMIHEISKIVEEAFT